MRERRLTVWLVQHRPAFCSFMPGPPVPPPPPTAPIPSVAPPVCPPSYLRVFTEKNNKAGLIVDIVCGVWYVTSSVLFKLSEEAVSYFGARQNAVSGMSCSYVF